MHEPLSRWWCDTCGEPITDPGRGLVTWQDDGTGARTGRHSFRIVHKSIGGRACDPGERAGYLGSIDLDHMIGDVGAARLSSWIGPGPLQPNGRVEVADIPGFAELQRRLLIPHYEEAHRHADPIAPVFAHDGVNGASPYMPGTLAWALSNLGGSATP